MGFFSMLLAEVQSGVDRAGFSAPVLDYGTVPQGTSGQNGYSKLPSTATGKSLFFEVVAGTLSILSLNSATGAIYGDIRASGTDVFTVRATDDFGRWVQQEVTLVVNPAPSIVETTLPDGTAGVSYSQNLTHADGTGNGTYSIPNSGEVTALAAKGLALTDNGNGTATIAGATPVAGDVEFTVRYTDTNGITADRTLDIHIAVAFPTFTIEGSDGMTGTGNVHGDTFDDALGGDGGTWNSSTSGTQVTESSGTATMANGAANEVMLNTDAQWSSEPTDSGLLVEGMTANSGVIPDFFIDRRDGSNGDFVAIRLQAGAVPKIVIGTVSLITPIYTVVATIDFDAASVIDTSAHNYFIRIREVAGAGGGLTADLYTGAFTAGQSKAVIEAGMTLIQSKNIFTPEARTFRDSAGTLTRGLCRVANGAGAASCTFSGLHWGRCA